MVIIGRFNKDETKEIFNISNGFETISIIALRYLGNLENLVEHFKQREHSHRTINH
jgi:hypothetical protein